MKEFYQFKFDEFYKERQMALKASNFKLWKQSVQAGGLNTTSKSDMDLIMTKFTELMFGSELMKHIGQIEKTQIINSMMTIVFSHRYSKGDKFILEAE